MSTVHHQQNPQLTTSILDNHNQYKFTLKDIHTSTANAIRRTILSDIPVYCIRTESEENNQCRISTNTTRFHNEIIKHRLSCIPVHFQVTPEQMKSIDKMKEPWDTQTPTPSLQYDLLRYELEVDVKNEKDHELQWVTTQDFKLKDKNSGKYMESEQVRKIFPPCSLTQRYIDFVRLRPPVGPTIPGEAIKLSADFSLSCARVNGMFNVASICTFQNTIDAEKREAALTQLRKELDAKEDMNADSKRFEIENFNQLQAQRYFVTNPKGEPIQFDFTVQSIGIYEPTDIVQMACLILMEKFRLIVQMAKAQELPVIPSERIRESGQYMSVTESSMENSYDIVLENEDYTVGNALERMLYDMYYEGDKTMHFVGFKKYHPHDSYSIIRIAYHKETPMLSIYEQIERACFELYLVFQKIHKKIV